MEQTKAEIPPSEPPQRVPENAPGDFYVEANMCTRCCLAHIEAPGLMNDPNAEFRECFFRRQPQTEAEVEQAINAVWVSEMGALRYGGTDQSIIRRLHAMKSGHCCDNPIDQKPSGEETKP
jgi:hypothetical protein